MAWCHEFGPRLSPGCSHPMLAASDSCSCPECGLVCTGRFAGCAAVWADGPKLVDRRRPDTPALHARALPSEPVVKRRSPSRSALQPRNTTSPPADIASGSPADTASDSKAELVALRSRLDSLVSALEEQSRALAALTARVAGFEAPVEFEPGQRTPRHLANAGTESSPVPQAEDATAPEHTGLRTSPFEQPGTSANGHAARPSEAGPSPTR